MIGRILWLSALAGIGAVTAALQLDRQAELSPHIAPVVPAPFRSYAQAQLAAAAVEEGDRAGALAAAEQLVRRRPMPSEHLTILAAAQAKAGRVEDAGFSIQMAGRRGWRDPIAQEAVLRLALDAGDKAEAARRYAALFRGQRTPDKLLITLAPEVLGDARGVGQDTFAGIIAAAPGWHDLFFQRGAQVLPPQIFGDVIDLALAHGAQFRCDTLTQAIAGLGQRDPAVAAKLEGPAARRCA